MCRARKNGASEVDLQREPIHNQKNTNNNNNNNNYTQLTATDTTTDKQIYTPYRYTHTHTLSLYQSNVLDPPAHQRCIYLKKQTNKKTVILLNIMTN